MRELKFRSMNEAGPNKWFNYFDLNAFDDHEGWKVCNDAKGDIQQFTGLMDKNGVEIWEGSILYWEDANIKAQVCWSDEDTGFWTKCMVDGISGGLCTEDYMYNFEVIGNIDGATE